MSTITLATYDLGQIKQNTHLINTSFLHLNATGGAHTEAAYASPATGPVRTINIKSERTNGATTNATIIGNIKALVEVDQSVSGPYTLAITDASGNVPAENIKVVIANFSWDEGPATNEVTFNLTLMECATW